MEELGSVFANFGLFGNCLSKWMFCACLHCTSGHFILSPQITTFSLFRFAGFKQQCWALSQMGLAPFRLRQTPGLQFCKLLGSGRLNGFSIWPNWAVYGLLGVWEQESAAQRFFDGHPVWLDYCRHSEAQQTVFLRTSMFHGAWDGQTPFDPSADFDVTAPVAVLTRATIRWTRLVQFWSRVPAVSLDVENRPGLQFAIGVGERPLVQQATFSLWDSGKHMLDYAYRRPQHAEVIRHTRALGWYKEELFARFQPYRSIGSGFWQYQG